MSSIDQEFVEFIVKSLVSKPDAVVVVRRIDEKGVLLELTVDPEDLGRVIGKKGATAQSLRTLLRALGTKNDARYNLKIIDNGTSKPDRESYTNTSHDQEDYANQSEVDDVNNRNEDAFKSVHEEENEEENDRYSKTRQELHDLDDLDV